MNNYLSPEAIGKKWLVPEPIPANKPKSIHRGRKKGSRNRQSTRKATSLVARMKKEGWG